jgi:hypothetical protein
MFAERMMYRIYFIQNGQTLVDNLDTGTTGILPRFRWLTNLSVPENIGDLVCGSRIIVLSVTAISLRPIYRKPSYILQCRLCNKSVIGFAYRVKIVLRLIYTCTL